MGNMERLEAMVARLPEAVRVDIEAWDGEPTFRVRGKNFVFTDREATGISVKLGKEEAAAVVATDDLAEPTGYGLGRHGWVSVRIGRAERGPLAAGRGVGPHLLHPRRPQEAGQPGPGRGAEQPEPSCRTGS